MHKKSLHFVYLFYELICLKIKVYDNKIIQKPVLFYFHYDFHYCIHLYENYVLL